MKISTPEAQGVPSKALERFVDKLKEQKLPVHSILMARHGHMIRKNCIGCFQRPKALLLLELDFWCLMV